MVIKKLHVIKEHEMNVKSIEECSWEICFPLEHVFSVFLMFILQGFIKGFSTFKKWSFLCGFLTVPELPPRIEKAPCKSLVNRMFGAMSSTVKYGNQMLDVVQKKTNGIVSNLPSKTLYIGQSPS